MTMRFVQHIMGTPISIALGGTTARREHADDAYAWLRDVDSRFSPFRGDSDVSRINRGERVSRHPDLDAVQDACARLWQQTSGYFDAYATGSFDPCGYVKGWAAQVASDQLAAAGVTDHFVNAGGDVCVRGNAPDGQPWRVGIRHPEEQHRCAWVLEVSDAAIATSGTYERGPHVIDPFTGRAATALVSVTVVGPDLGVADAYATAAVAMGEAALDWLAMLDGYESAAIAADGRAFRSARLPTVPA
ncbi:FAD:protein FMN transferase [Hamadaea sp. NPDC050747]|uniref:FAD:protein FMN transferase n=1 Tax=Hamadaea sp. NPDC050747 TaxID=3155789 RepID=UPI0033E8D133